MDNMKTSIKNACELGESLSIKYNPSGITPFPFEEILKEESCLKIFYSDEALEKRNLSGAIIYEKDEDKYLITINKCISQKRQYFTIAHELGHYFLHKDILKSEEIIVDDNSLVGAPTLYRPNNSDNSILEKEANNFAACLIMPERLVRNSWEELQDIEELAKIFRVSTIAMTVRLDKLGLVQ